MQNFMFSINATIPIFIVIIIGYILKERKILNNEFADVANKLVFQICLPVLLFRDLASTDIIGTFDLKFVLFCMIATTISFFGIWGLARIFLKDKSIIGAFVQASFRGSAAVLGIAFIQNIYGDAGMAPLMIVGAVPLFNIYSVIVLTFEGMEQTGSGKANARKAIMNICKNPIILGILIGIAGSVCNVYAHIPPILDKTINNIAVLATPLALLSIGVAFEGRKALTKIKPTIAATILKLVALTVIFLPIAIGLGFRDQKLIALLVMLGAPSTPTCYIMAKNMKNDGVISSSIIVTTTIVSSVTLTGWIYILKATGMII